MSINTRKMFKYPTCGYGFTLIEVLIVIVIVGIVSSLTLYALGDFGLSREAKVAAEQLSSYLQLLEQRATLETSTLSVQFSMQNNTLSGYQTYRLNNASQWRLIPQTTLFHWQAFPAKILVHFESDTQSPTQKPDIIINPSGDISPFTLFFGTRQTPQLIQLVGKPNGEIVLQNVPKS